MSHDLVKDPHEVIANPFVDEMAERSYLFHEEEDVRKWAHIVSKSPAFQDGKLGIQSDKYGSLLEDEEENFGQFPLTGISHVEDQNLFANFTDYLLDYEQDKN